MFFFFSRREAVPVRVRGLRQEVRKQQRPKKTHARSHVGQTVPMQNVRQVVHASQLSKKTHEGKYPVSGRACSTQPCVMLMLLIYMPQQRSIHSRFLIYLLLCIFFFSRSTNHPHQRQTPHQQPAPGMSPPHLQALCLPPPRPKATPPCPQPQLCTPPATVASPPISVNGMCRTELK